jgi:hypothetical protein
MSTSQTTGSSEARKDAASVLGAASSAVHPTKIGIGQKVAIAGTLLRLARRYPVAALVIGGVVIALYVGRRRAYGPVTRH